MYGAHKFVFSNTLTDGYCQPKMLPFQKKKKEVRRTMVSPRNLESLKMMNTMTLYFYVEVSPSVADVYSLEEKL